MEKLITRKNLLILNIVFVVVFLLLSLKAVWPIVSGKRGRTTDTGGRQHGTDEGPVLAQRAEPSEYDIIIKNDLFVSKVKVAAVKQEKPSTYYDITKVWTLQSTRRDPDTGEYIASIRDKNQPNRDLGKPYTEYDVKVGDIIESDKRGRSFKVKILEIRRGYVKYHRLDMEGDPNKTEEDRIFESEPW